MANNWLAIGKQEGITHRGNHVGLRRGTESDQLVEEDLVLETLASAARLLLDELLLLIEGSTGLRLDRIEAVAGRELSTSKGAPLQCIS